MDIGCLEHLYWPYNMGQTWAEPELVEFKLPLIDPTWCTSELVGQIGGDTEFVKKRKIVL